MTTADMTDGDHPDTLLASLGRRREWTHGIVNPPVYHASTCVFETLADYDRASANPDAGLYYARRGTPTSWALEEALTMLEPGAAGTKVTSSGVAAITVALLAVLNSGDHVLIMDSAYEPTRLLADDVLLRLGIEVSYYDPLAHTTLAEAFRPNTKAIMVESPGSLTFEVQDIPAIAALAHAQGVAVIMDNTWATSLYFQALAHGVDIVVQSITKYIIGHSDALMGAVTANARWWPRVKTTTYRLGQCAGPDDVFLALRGLRTLSVRLARHQASALKVATWLKAQPMVAQVLYPALPDCPGHEYWERDFRGASGLFSVLLQPAPRTRLTALIDGLRHFKIGFSWGGYESLILPANPKSVRTAKPWTDVRPAIRLHIGLEDPEDLIADLAAGLERYSDKA